MHLIFANPNGYINPAPTGHSKSAFAEPGKRHPIGTIDFVWGDSGKGAPKNKGAHGLAGIIAKHSEKSVRAMPEVIAKGDLGDADPRYKGTRKVIRFGDYTAVVSLVEGEEKRTWLLNGFGPFENDPREQHERLRQKGMIKIGGDDVEEFSDNIDSTHPAPTRFSSQDGSTSLMHILPQTPDGGEVNTMNTETLISYGGALKSLSEDKDTMKIGGYLVKFGSPDDHDSSALRDYFDKDKARRVQLRLSDN